MKQEKKTHTLICLSNPNNKKIPFVFCHIDLLCFFHFIEFALKFNI